MKVKILPSTLERVVKDASTALTSLSGKDDKDFYKCIYIEAKDNGTLLATSQNSTYRMTVQGDAIEVAEPGSALVDGEKLCKLCANMPKYTVTLSDACKGGLRLKSGGNQSTLVCYPTGDGISWCVKDVCGQGEDWAQIMVNEAEIEEALRSIRYARGSEIANYSLTGVQIVAKQNGMLFATCMDGLRLATRRVECSASRDLDIVIPGDVINAVCTLTSKSASSMRLMTNGSILSASTEKGWLNTVLHKAQWPDWKQFFPKANEIIANIRVETKQIKKAVERAKILCQDTKKIAITIEDQSICLDSKGPLGEYTERIQADVQHLAGYGKDADENGGLEVLLNVKYLLQALSSCAGAQEVEFSVASRLKPIVLSPIGSYKAKHLIMPIVAQSHQENAS